MKEIAVIRPEIPLNDFLPIFLSSTLVLVFGVFFVAIFTLVKMRYLKGYFMPMAYLFWGLQTYSLYYLGVKIQSDPFTIKVLFLAMLAYLSLPHLYYYLNVKAEEI